MKKNRVSRALFTLIISQTIAFTVLALGSKNEAFLTLNQYPDSLAILPPPPTDDSIAFSRDKAAYQEGYRQKGTERWQQAISDANLSDSNIGKPFSEAFGMEISRKNTPITYKILKKLRTDNGDYSIKVAKEHYMRQRPFMFFDKKPCTPEDESKLRKSGSYPSGTTSMGWATALILSEINPERQNQLLKRGYEFGQSRVVCGAHWQSDVDAGRIAGAAGVARLHADKTFMAELEEAKQEINNKLAKNK